MRFVRLPQSSALTFFGLLAFMRSVHVTISPQKKKWPDRAMARAEPGLDYQTTRFGGPQPDPVSRLRLPSYGCGAVWPRGLQLDAVCQVAAVFCPDLFWAACVHEIRPCNN